MPILHEESPTSILPMLRETRYPGVLTMNIQNSHPMSPEFNTKQLWIGMVEVRPTGEGSEILGEAKGAFVNIVTWASDAAGYEGNVRRLIRDLGGLHMAEVVSPEPVAARRARTKGAFEEEIEDIISRAQDNPNAIIYGTFHTFERD